MAGYTPEMIEKAKAAKTEEELLELAKVAGIELSEEEAKAYFEMLNPKTGELSDDELDAVTGGGCKSKKSGRTVVSSNCKCFTGQYESIYLDDKQHFKGFKRYDNVDLRTTWARFTTYYGRCGVCVNLEFEAGTGVCGKS